MDDSLHLPGRQDELIRRVAGACPRTVVVLNTGSPMAMPWRDEVPAVVMACFPRQEGGDALTDILLGTVEPSGRRRRGCTAPRSGTGAQSVRPRGLEVIQVYVHADDRRALGADHPDQVLAGFAELRVGRSSADVAHRLVVADAAGPAVRG